MIINKCKTQITGVCILILLTFSYKGFCQQYSIIDIDKIEVLKLPERQKGVPIPDGMLKFNDIIRVKNKSKTSYVVDFIPSSQPPILSNGNAFVNLNNKEKVYDFESVNEITNALPFQYKYKVFEFEDKKQTVSLLGASYEIVEYVVSIDLTTGDTLWKKQIDYVSVHPAKQVSLVGNFIIDNKSGKEIFKLSSSNPISISEVKEDDRFLYLKTNGSELIAIDLQKGEVIWKVKGKFNKIFLDDTKIYTSNQCAIDKQTGKLVWSNSSDIWIVGIVGNYLIGYLYGEDDPEIFAYNKNTGKLAGYLWSDDEFCTSCFGYESCFPNFVFAEQGEENKTVALIKCNDRIYLYTFEVTNN